MKTEFVNETSLNGPLMQQYAQKMLWTYKKRQIITNVFSMLVLMAVGGYAFATSPQPLFAQKIDNLSGQEVLGIFCFLLALISLVYLLKLIVLDNLRAQRRFQTVEGQYPHTRVVVNDEGIFVHQGDRSHQNRYDQVVGFLETKDLGIILVQEKPGQSRGILVQKENFVHRPYTDFRHYLLKQVQSARTPKV